MHTGNGAVADIVCYPHGNVRITYYFGITVVVLHGYQSDSHDMVIAIRITFGTYPCLYAVIDIKRIVGQGWLYIRRYLISGNRLLHRDKRMRERNMRCAALTGDFNRNIGSVYRYDEFIITSRNCTVSL